MARRLGYTSIAAAKEALGQTGGGMDFSKIIQQMQAQQEKANAANEARYQEILGLYSGLGKAGETRIAQQETRQLATGQQGLISRGLGSTTITAGLERGVASDAELARQQLGESIAVQKAGVMERRTDVGPDIGMYANLLQAASQGQAAGGGGGSTFTGLGPMASRGLDVFGRPMGGGFGGGGDSSQAAFEAATAPP